MYKFGFFNKSRLARTENNNRFAALRHAELLAELKALGQGYNVYSVDAELKANTMWDRENCRYNIKYRLWK